MVSKFKKILSYLATIPPGELNRNSIAKNIGLDNKTVQYYLNILHETGLIELINKNKSGSNLLKQTKNNLSNAYLVKDNILYGSKYEIPLYLFGFLY